MLAIRTGAALAGHPSDLIREAALAKRFTQAAMSADNKALAVRHPQLDAVVVWKKVLERAKELGLTPPARLFTERDMVRIHYGDIMKMEMTSRVVVRYVKIDMPFPVVVLVSLQEVKNEIFSGFWSQFKEIFSLKKPTDKESLLRPQAIQLIKKLRDAGAVQAAESNETLVLQFEETTSKGDRRMVEFRSKEDVIDYLDKAEGTEELKPLGSPPLYDFEWFHDLFRTPVMMHGSAKGITLHYHLQEAEDKVTIIEVNSDEVFQACVENHASGGGRFECYFAGSHRRAPPPQTYTLA